MPDPPKSRPKGRFFHALMVKCFLMTPEEKVRVQSQKAFTAIIADLGRKLTAKDLEYIELLPNDQWKVKGPLAEEIRREKTN